MVYVFLADGFEDVEALAPIDLMRRAGIDVKTVSVSGENIVTSSHGVPVVPDCAGAELSDGTEMIVLPGGGRGTENLRASRTVRDALLYCAEKGIPIAAICAAPSVPGELGLLDGHNATCFPGFESYLKGANYTGEAVCEDGNFITGKSAGHALTFGLKIIERLRGREAADKVALAIYQNA